MWICIYSTNPKLNICPIQFPLFQIPKMLSAPPALADLRESVTVGKLEWKEGA